MEGVRMGRTVVKLRSPTDPMVVIDISVANTVELEEEEKERSREREKREERSEAGEYLLKVNVTGLPHTLDQFELR